MGSSRTKAWVAAGGGLLVLGLVGYVMVVDRNCDEISDVPRGSLRFRVCGVANEAIAAVPITDAIGQVTYTVRYHDGLKPAVSDMKYASARSPEEVRGALEAFLSGKGFALARREIDMEWWSDKRTEMGVSIRGTTGRGADVEIIHNTGFE